MKKNMFLCMMILYAFIYSPLSAYSQANDQNVESNQPAPAQESSQVVQTGEVSTKEKFIKSTENSEIIQGDKITNPKVSTVSDVLTDLPSFNLTTGTRGETLFRYRGFDQKQVPILMDGIPIYIPYDGILSTDRLPSFGIDKIQIIKSSPSVIYGPNTMGGVINLITQKPTKPFELRVGFQDNYVNTLSEYIRMSGINKNFYFNLNHTFSKSHGFELSKSFDPTLNEGGGIRDNSQYHNLNLSGKVGYSSSDKQDINVMYSFLSAPWNVPPEVGVAKPRYWKFDEWRKNTLIFSVHQPVVKENIIFNGNFYYDKYFNILDAYDNNKYNTQKFPSSFHSTYDDHSIGFNILPEFNISNKIAIKPVFTYKRDVHNEMGNYNSPNSKYKISTTTLGGVITLNPVERLSLEAGVTADNYNPIYNNGFTLRDDIWKVNTSGGIMLNVTKNNRLSFNIGQKSRFPTLKEMYSGFIGKNIPNPNLLPETSLSYEFSYDTELFNRLQYGIDFFRNDIDDLIVDVAVGKKLFQLQNVSKAVTQGIETNVNIDIIKDRLSFNTGYIFLNAQNESENRLNNYLPYIPKHKIYSGLVTKLPYGIDLSFDFKYVGKVLYQDYLDTKWKKLGGYPVFGINVSKTFKDYVTVYTAIENVLDKNYQTEARYPMPGFNILFGLRVNI